MATKKTTTKKKVIRKKRQPLKKISRNKAAKKVAKGAVASPEPRQIVATPELTKGVYCNVANVKHTEREFVLDFILGIDNHYALVSRVITNPAHIKQLAQVLAEQVAQYEKSYGEIAIGKQAGQSSKVH